MRPRLRRIEAVFLVTGAVIVLLLLGLSNVNWAWRASELRSGTHLKALALAYRMYAGENGGVLPPVDDEYPLSGSVALLYPRYVHSLEMLVSPLDRASASLAHTDSSVRESFRRSSYMYLGVLWTSADQGDVSADGQSPALGDARDEFVRALAPRGGPPGETDRVPILVERPRLYPGSWGVLLWSLDLPLSSPQLGGVVAYSNGEVEFVPYPGRWPMMEPTIAALDDIGQKPGR